MPVMQKVFNIPQENTKGIYAIVNIKKMRCYIGSSSKIKSRAAQHINDLKSNKHANRFLQEDFDNNAEFDFLILELVECSKEVLNAKEKMYMLESLKNGFELYNLMPSSKNSSQEEWIKQHLIWYLLSQNNTKNNLIKSFKNFYGVTPAYMKNRLEENRR